MEAAERRPNNLTRREIFASEREDGQIMYHGRRDHMVKVNGFASRTRRGGKRGPSPLLRERVDRIPP